MEERMAGTSSSRMFEKPLQRLGINEWHSKTNQVCDSALLQCSIAFDLRQACRNFRDETQLNTNYNKTNTKVCLANRVQELERWHTELSLWMNRLIKEINLLRIEKSLTENDLDALNIPLSVVSECLAVRDGRVIGELTTDEVETELRRELLIIEQSAKVLRDQCSRSWEYINRLNEIKAELNVELLHKTEAHTCDSLQIILDDNVMNVPSKIDPMRNPKNSIAYKGWLEHTKQIKRSVENGINDSCRLRESLFVAREKVKNSLRNQHEITEHTLRKRIFDTRCVCNELEWQIIKTKNEMETLTKEINELRVVMEENAKAAKLAESRLENRCQRPGKELCMDDVYTQLCKELKQLHFTYDQINEKNRRAKISYNELEINLKHLENELRKKKHTLDTNIRSNDTRKTLKCMPTENDILEKS